MLRYIYLLCFIINFELVFCYNYINSPTSQRRAQHRIQRRTEPKEKARFNRQTELRQESRLKRQDYGFEDKLVDQIDVASFIQKPDEDYEPLTYDSKMRQPKQHNVFRTFNEIYPTGLPRDRREPLPARSYQDPQAPLVPPAPSARNAPPDPRNPLAPNDLISRVADETTLSNYQQQMLMDRQLVHNPKKKCSLTKMFPFFSHNKAVHAKKGTKKKKPCGTCSKKAKKHQDPFTESENVNLREKKKNYRERSTDESRIQKRYAEQICPKCKMKYLRMRKKRWDLPKMIHNSRQYYAHLNNAVKDSVETSSKQFDKVNVKKRFGTNEVKEARRKNGQDYLSQIEKQFKTLEELEKRVDSVEI